MDRDLAFPILKFEHGFYLFGTKKMFMKVLFDGLLVKVGSNFLTVSDFLASYYDKEEKAIKERAAMLNLTIEQTAHYLYRQLSDD